MQISSRHSDAAILGELGHRVGRARVAADITQAEMAANAGVSERTIRSLESGAGVQVETLVRVLRELGLLSGLDGLLPEGGPTPIELADLRRRERRRARRGKPGRDPGSGEQPWRWGEER